MVGMASSSGSLVLCQLTSKETRTKIPARNEAPSTGREIVGHDHYVGTGNDKVERMQVTVAPNGRRPAEFSKECYARRHQGCRGYVTVMGTRKHRGERIICAHKTCGYKYTTNFPIIHESIFILFHEYHFIKNTSYKYRGSDRASSNVAIEKEQQNATEKKQVHEVIATYQCLIKTVVLG